MNPLIEALSRTGTKVDMQAESYLHLPARRGVTNDVVNTWMCVLQNYSKSESHQHVNIYIFRSRLQSQHEQLKTLF
jgi:hypothetical protein